MQRFVVILLSALDALLSALLTLAIVVVPLVVFWVLAVPDAGGVALWRTAAAIWQLGHGTPVLLALPRDYASAIGVDPGFATFSISLIPLTIFAVTLMTSARSGARAASARAWGVGVLTNTVVIFAVATVVALSTRDGIAHTEFWQAALFPALVTFAGALLGAVPVAWSEGDDGLVDRFRRRVGEWPGSWSLLLPLVVRGVAIAVMGLLGAGALGLAASILLHGPDIVALSQSAHLDPLGVVFVELGQLSYLPTLVVWAVSYLAGPGFAVAAGATISPVGTSAGVLPAVPVLAALPPTGVPVLLVLVIVPILIGALAGAALRSRIDRDLRWQGQADAGTRAALTVSLALLSGIVVAILSALASGAIGPGRLAQLGPSPLAVGIAIALEVGIGAGILLLAPRRPGGAERPQ